MQLKPLVPFLFSSLGLFALPSGLAQALTIPFAPRAPVIDGRPDIESNWYLAQNGSISKVLYPQQPASESRPSFKVIYDEQFLYFTLSIQDSSVFADSGSYPWDDDSIEIFIDGDNSKNQNWYDDNDFQFIFRGGDIFELKHGRIDGVQSARWSTQYFQTYEIKIPLSLVKITPWEGKTLGLEIEVNSDNNGGGRDQKYSWKADVDQAWQNPALFETVQLGAKLGGAVRVNTPPVIDGDPTREMDIWTKAPLQIMNNYISLSTPQNILKSNFYAVYDDNNLYIMNSIQDDVNLTPDSGDQYWNDDSSEVYIDANYNRLWYYDNQSFQFILRGDEAYEVKHNALGGVVAKRWGNRYGRVIEMSIPWSTLGIQPSSFRSIGFDLHVNDDDNGGVRDAKLVWFDRTDEAWKYPARFGTLILLPQN